jgi:hypothetical protein
LLLAAGNLFVIWVNQALAITQFCWANHPLEMSLFAELIRGWKFLNLLSWSDIDILSIAWANQMLESSLFAELIRYGPWEMFLILELIRFGKFLYLVVLIRCRNPVYVLG